MSFDALSSCITTLQSSAHLLQNSLDVLDGTTHDMLRLSAVLNKKTFFQVKPQCDIDDIKKNLSAEITPKISTTLAKLENELSRLQRKKINLINKADLQQIRIENLSSYKSAKKPSKVVKGSDLQVSRLKFLQNKKDRLKYSLNRLTRRSPNPDGNS
ncbi:hypothetical protein BABINDRAFT_7635 [Babjeviella inositovora NRRL Y-12698]|uniref:DASH complex subunit SPC19 n=1 Tax=Babjeviella inositovora NRRL Y-12698 TaxID=984486 RepID=A0A1E3QR83_9ASCO|nr:uncharacterized protein BABINDRAFT_7635 [Babjeviella inositovora NRRL Y-12698]ODQ80160.1 hypothetical protein BABINDRAFT_7635 [Babjeviella inositovora NRRL Y-12698]